MPRPKALSIPSQIDVVIAGAGPVGLLLAIELKLGGAAVVVLERLATPSSAIKGTSIGPLGAEVLQRRGMGLALDEAEDRAFAVRGPRGAEMRAQAFRSRGQFASVPLRSEAREPQRRLRWVDQQGVEAILGARAAALGIAVRRGCEVTGFEQDAEGVEVTLTAAAGPERIRCAFLVGCDGGRSIVRRLGGFAFAGAQPSVTMYQAVLDLDHPERLPRWSTRTAEGVVVNGPRPRWLALHDFSAPPADREAPVTREEIERVLRRISGVDVRVTAVDQANRFSDVTRLADSYRRDRLLLAGDAAHVHAPLGGQGLSLGLVDAANLGWKLAAVIRGDRPVSFLDSYTSERRPVAEAVLANTLAQVALARPDPRSEALRDMFVELMQLDEANAYVDGLINGLGTHYDLGSERAEVGRLVGDRETGPAEARSTLFAQMANGDGILLDASPDGAASDVAARFSRVRHVGTETGPSMLIRPDGCIAWIESDATSVTEALSRWFAPAA